LAHASDADNRSSLTEECHLPGYETYRILRTDTLHPGEEKPHGGRLSPLSRFLRGLPAAGHEEKRDDSSQVQFKICSVLSHTQQLQ
jgi:hypothetical protein